MTTKTFCAMNTTDKTAAEQYAREKRAEGHAVSVLSIGQGGPYEVRVSYTQTPNRKPKLSKEKA